MKRDYFTCRELVELVTEYLEGALSARELAIFEAHFSACPGCIAYVEQMRQTIKLAGRLSADSITPQARDALLLVFRNWKKVGSNA